jgi:hypothetical protein
MCLEVTANQLSLYQVSAEKGVIKPHFFAMVRVMYYECVQRPRCGSQLRQAHVTETTNVDSKSIPTANRLLRSLLEILRVFLGNEAASRCPALLISAALFFAPELPVPTHRYEIDDHPTMFGASFRYSPTSPPRLHSSIDR